MLFWLAFACTKSSKEVEKTPSEDVDSTQTVVDSLGEPRDSVCRGLVLPSVDRKGCVVKGPYQGTLAGFVLSEIYLLNKPSLHCNPKCSGISTEWYSDTPFVAVQKTARFSVDSDSYGCTFIVNCSE